MRAPRALPIVALLSAGCGAEDECIERRFVVGLNQPGPWDQTPTEVFSHAQGTRVGTWEWLGGADVLEVVPASGQVSFTAQLTLTGDDAIAVDSTKRGSGRLACTDRLEMSATLEVQTSDGALDDVFEVTAVAEGGFGNSIVVVVDLGEAKLDGSLAIAPKDGGAFEDRGVLFMTRWDDDGMGQVRGTMFYGEQTQTDGPDGLLTGSGAVREFARFSGGSP